MLALAHSLGVIFKKQKLHDEAEALLVKAAESRRSKLGDDHPDTLDSLKNLIELYEVWGKPESAERCRAKLPQIQAVKKESQNKQ